jgi:hypothetical protein
MINRKLKLFVVLGLLLVLLLLGVYSFGDIKYSSKEGLSYGEKKRDAKYLMDFLEDTYPYFEELNTITGQDFLKERTKIINSISKTSSDAEFIKTLNDFFRKFIFGAVGVTLDIPPNSNAYTYFDEKLGITERTFNEKLYEGKLKWGPIQKEYWDKLFNTGYPCNLNANYLDGEYYISMSQHPEVHVGDLVISIDGMDVHEYVKTLPYDRYYSSYDFLNKKNVMGYLFTPFGKTPKEITIKNSSNEEKKIELLPFDPNKPILEDGFSAYKNGQKVEISEMPKVNFINPTDDGNILALNFSAFEEVNKYFGYSRETEKLYSNINNCNYLILDFRDGFNPVLFNLMIEYISPKNIEYFDYKVIKKNEINDKYIEYLKGYPSDNTTEVTSSLESLEKVYPLSKYHILKEKRISIKGNNRYSGKVFILIRNGFSSDYSNAALKKIVENNYATVISDGKLPVYGYIPDESTISTVLPNSNLGITVQNVKLVDSNGTFASEVFVTPQIIIKKDKAKYADNLRKGEGYGPEIPEADRYTSKDEYYVEVLKLIN